MDGISEKIRQIKKERGMTAKELSEKSGIPVATLNRVLAGKGKSVKTDKLAALADALGVRTSDLIESGAGIVVTAKKDYGFVRVGAVTPRVAVGDVRKNADAVKARIVSYGLYRRRVVLSAAVAYRSRKSVGRFA